MRVPNKCIDVLLENPDLNRGHAILFLRIAKKTTCRCGSKNCYKARTTDVLGGTWLQKLFMPKAVKQIETYACIDCEATYSR